MKAKVPKKKEIVKVQISLSTSEDAPQVLVYNEDHSIFYQADATQEIIKRMGISPKRFFYSHITKAKKISLDKEAPWQDW